MPEYVERTESQYTNLSNKFRCQLTFSNKQYYKIYIARIGEMRKFLEERALKKWGEKYSIIRLHKLFEERHEKCIIVGTLFKNQKLKPSILKQLMGHHNITPQPIMAHLTDESDQLFIEDELQRLEIIGGSLKCEKFVTGVTCALLGSDDGKGKFFVEDYEFAGLRPQIQRPLVEEPIYVALISGLNLENIETFTLCSQILVSWLSGVIGDLGTFKTSQISRLIIAGNSVGPVEDQVEAAISILSRKAATSDELNMVKLLDNYLLQLAQIIDVDLMPGKNDPSNFVLPQQPIHHCLLPQSSIYKSLNRVTNPYHFSINGSIFLGTSGQNITDISRFSELEDGLESMENCLNWGHLAPTAPDTLGCYPYEEADPFIIKECPHIFFAGNQSKFDTKMVVGPEGQKVRLISIPEFSKTGEVCLVNLVDLKCRKVALKLF